MARKGRNEIAVGITVLAVVALTIYIVVMLADWSAICTLQQKITVRLPYKVGLKGIRTGSPVYLGGLKIGTVTNTEIEGLTSTAADGGDVSVLFTMKIPKECQLRDDCVLLPQSNVLGGQVLLSIEDLGAKGRVIQDGETVDLTLADGMMEAIRDEFDSADPESLLAMLKYEVNRKNDDSVVSSLKKVAVELEEAIPVMTARIEQTLVEAGLALKTAQSALEDMKELTSDERIDKMINNFAEVSTNLKLTSQEVRRAPWKLLYRPKEREFKIQGLVDAAGSFAVGAESLDSITVRLQTLIAQADNEQSIDKDKLESIMSQLEASFNQFQKAERKFWEELE